MATCVALLRAVNVGGTGRLPMPELREMCGRLGLRGARTYIASGNVVFDSDLGEAEVKAALLAELRARLGPAAGVAIRTAAELAAVLAANPFPQGDPARVHAVFLDAPPPDDLLAGVAHRTDEEIAPGLREIYLHYPSGQGASKLKLPAARAGTARNMNTVARLVEMAAG